MPTVRDLRHMAKELKVKNYSKMKKDSLIRSIQEAEGNSPCFQRIPDCGEVHCLFREECLPEA
ncbi:MAG: Rho termination factor N-terminal domain-containing protein [Desulfarculaceae bacterium]